MDYFSKLILNEICAVLETYKGRDKVLRTLCYSTKLVGGLTDNPQFAKRWETFSSQMSATRAVLRLLDDLPMLKYTLEYGLGKEEPDKFMASVGVATNFVDQVYYPIEKMAWLAEHKLISGHDGKPWDTASSVCWVISIYLTLMRSLRYVNILQQHKACIDAKTDQSALRKLLATQQLEMLMCIRLSLDFVHAVNTLPPGFLWSSKLKSWHVGLIGTLSSVLGMYQLFAKRAIQ